MHSKCVLACRSGAKCTQKCERERETPSPREAWGEPALLRWFLSSQEWGSPSFPACICLVISLPSLPQPLLIAMESCSCAFDADRDCNYDGGGEAGKAAEESGGEQLVTKRGGGRVDLFPEMLQGTSYLSFSLVWKVEPDRT